MKITRKLQEKMESKIRHHLATGVLPVIKRSPELGSESRSPLDKTDSRGK